MIKKVIKNVESAKDHASKMGQDALKKASEIQDKVKTGVKTSKGLFEKATGFLQKVVNKDKISQGIDSASKGVELVAKGARMASKGADTVATRIERASQQMRKAKDKIK